MNSGLYSGLFPSKQSSACHVDPKLSPRLSGHIGSQGNKTRSDSIPSHNCQYFPWTHEELSRSDWFQLHIPLYHNLCHLVFQTNNMKLAQDKLKNCVCTQKKVINKMTSTIVKRLCCPYFVINCKRTSSTSFLGVLPLGSLSKLAFLVQLSKSPQHVGLKGKEHRPARFTLQRDHLWKQTWPVQTLKWTFLIGRADWVWDWDSLSVTFVLISIAWPLQLKLNHFHATDLKGNPALENCLCRILISLWKIKFDLVATACNFSDVRHCVSRSFVLRVCLAKTQFSKWWQAACQLVLLSRWCERQIKTLCEPSRSIFVQSENTCCTSVKVYQIAVIRKTNKHECALLVHAVGQISCHVRNRS